MFWERTDPIETPRLTAAVENAYKAFSDCKFHGPLIHCSCNLCMTDEHAKILSAKPLREIPTWLLAEYTNSAHDHNEHVETQLKYFLPRYFELIAECDPPSDFGLQVMFSGLAKSGWRERWHEKHLNAFDEFCFAFLEACCQQLEVCEWPAGHRIAFDMSEVLSMVVTCEGDLQRLLDTFEGCSDPGAALHMANLRSQIKVRIGGKPYLGDAFMSDYREQAEQIAEFLLSEKLDKRIMNCINLIDKKDYHQYRETIEIAMMGW